jgi:hypothetical protein
MTRLLRTSAALRTALAALASLFIAACGSQITPDNFARIENGMSQQQVTSILGQPTDTSVINIAGISGGMSTWTDGRTTISIQFVNDKVQAKQLAKSAIR